MFARRSDYEVCSCRYLSHVVISHCYMPSKVIGVVNGIYWKYSNACYFRTATHSNAAVQRVSAFLVSGRHRCPAPPNRYCECLWCAAPNRRYLVTRCFFSFFSAFSTDWWWNYFLNRTFYLRNGGAHRATRKTGWTQEWEEYPNENDELPLMHIHNDNWYWIFPPFHGKRRVPHLRSSLVLCIIIFKHSIFLLCSYWYLYFTHSCAEIQRKSKHTEPICPQTKKGSWIN